MACVAGRLAAGRVPGQRPRPVDWPVATEPACTACFALARLKRDFFGAIPAVNQSVWAWGCTAFAGRHTAVIVRRCDWCKRAILPARVQSERVIAACNHLNKVVELVADTTI